MLHKHPDLSSNAQNLCKAGVTHICNLRASVIRWEVGTQECPKAGRPTSVVYTEEQRDSEPKGRK